MAARRTRKDDGSQWTVADSRSVYGIRHWGAGFFSINDAGRVEVRPNGPDSAPIDLYAQLDDLRGSGLSLPLLVRFPEILQYRVRQLTSAFDAARNIPSLTRRALTASVARPTPGKMYELFVCAK